LVAPLFLVLMIGVIEFAFLMNANLSTSFATRDAALVAAEGGDSPGADCLILKKIEDDISAPADDAAITSVEIYWSDQNGNVKNGAINRYTRTPSTPAWACPVGGTTVTVHFGVPPITSLLYPETDRCNVILGTGCSSGHTGLDTIGVKVTYQYIWHTPLRCLVGLLGTGSGGCYSNTAGWTLVSSNAMRMEPVL
jgi:Flp pilus assembly protein TadG